jgi:hypothetical protein
MSTAALLAPPTMDAPTLITSAHVTNTARLRVLPTTGPCWFRGLARPDVVHLLETEDGQPRRVKVDGRAFPVAPAPCRAFLLGRGLPSPILVGTAVCSECKVVAEFVHGLDWAMELAAVERQVASDGLS